MRPSSSAHSRAAVCLVVSLLAGVPARGAMVSVGQGTSLSLGSSSIDMGCGHLVIAGSVLGGTALLDRAQDVDIVGNGVLVAESGTYRVTGDWNNSNGGFISGSSSVEFVDGCGRSSAAITGSTSFNDLQITSSTGKSYQLEAGATQTVAGNLSLSGAPGSLLLIRSTVEGSEAFLNLSGTSSTSYVDVADNHAVGKLIWLDANSTASGNTSGWKAASEIPALGMLPLLLLALAIATLAARILRPAQRYHPS